jgi:CRP-like cAMP-binding protein
MSESDHVAMLEKLDLFAGLSNRVLRRLAQSGREERYDPGAAVLQEGEPVSGFRAFSEKGVELHVVLQGGADVSVGGTSHGTLSPGDYFGELSLIDGAPRSADVTAGPDGLRTFALPKWTFEALLADHPEIAVPMLKVMVGRLRASEAEHRSD